MRHFAESPGKRSTNQLFVVSTLRRTAFYSAKVQSSGCMYGVSRQCFLTTRHAAASSSGRTARTRD